ncbi:MAG: DUF3800 domain-containing protein [bacterium]
MKYYFFLDETGDHGLSYIDKNFPIFLLCGCLFSEDSLRQTENTLNDFKRKYFNTIEVIMHSREIRKCEGAFQILFDLNLKEKFYNDLNNILDKADFKIIGAVVNKEEHIKKYGAGAKDPYALSLSFIIERLIFCVDLMDKNASVDIQVEERGRKEDDMLLAHYNTIKDRGTFYVSTERMIHRLKSFKFFNKRENVLGLQVADLCAYPLARYVLNPRAPYIPFDVIKSKIYCNSKGEFEGWGLKQFP